MLKTYFCELVPGFLPDRNQTSLGQFSGLSRSIIIKKKLNFAFWFTIIGSFIERGVSKYTQMPINHKGKLRTSQKLVSMCDMTSLTSMQSFIEIGP